MPLSSRVAALDRPTLVGLLAAAAVSFVLSGFAAFTVGDVGIRFSWLLGVAVVVYGGVRVLRTGRLVVPLPVVVLGALFCWLLVGVVGPLASGNAGRLREFGFGVARFGLFFSLVVALANSGIDEDDTGYFLAATVLTGVAVSAYGLYQFFARPRDWPFAYLQLSNPSLSKTVQSGKNAYTGGVFNRVSGTFSEPSWLGIYQIDVLVILGVLLLYGRADALPYCSRRRCLGALSVVSVAFVVAFSLGAYASFGALSLVFLALEWRTAAVRSRLPKTVAALGGLFVAFDLLFTGARVTMVVLRRGRTVGLKAVDSVLGSGGPDGTTSGPEWAERSTLSRRMTAADEALNGFRERAVTGVGINNHSFFLPEGYSNVPFTYSRLLSEVGLVGFGLFLGAIGTLGRRLYARVRAARRVDADRDDLFLAALFYVLVGYLASAVFVGTLYQVRFWLFFGLATALLAHRGDPYEVTLPVALGGDR